MRLSLPLSIILASVILAIGLAVGLRTGTDGTPPAHGEPAPASAPPPAPPAAARAAVAEAPPGPTEQETAAHVTAVVVEAHPRWKAACWDTADPTTRTPGRYVAALAFDAAGMLTISGVGEVRGASDASVAQCLRQQVNRFTIPAPGHAVAFDVPFTMP